MGSGSDFDSRSERWWRKGIFPVPQGRDSRQQK